VPQGAPGLEPCKDLSTKRCSNPLYEEKCQPATREECKTVHIKWQCHHVTIQECRHLSMEHWVDMMDRQYHNRYVEKNHVEHENEKECHPVQRQLQETPYEEHLKHLLTKHFTTVSSNKCDTKQEKECSIFYEEQCDKDSNQCATKYGNGCDTVYAKSCGLVFDKWHDHPIPYIS
jgi:hypothetical protein